MKQSHQLITIDCLVKNTSKEVCSPALMESGSSNLRNWKRSELILEEMILWVALVLALIDMHTLNHKRSAAIPSFFIRTSKKYP
jgi:hypothetical protein